MKRNKRKQYKINQKNEPGKGNENSNDHNIRRYRVFRPLDTPEGGMIEIGIERNYTTSRELWSGTNDSDDYDYFHAALSQGVSKEEWDFMMNGANRQFENILNEESIKEVNEGNTKTAAQETKTFKELAEKIIKILNRKETRGESYDELETVSATPDAAIECYYLLKNLSLELRNEFYSEYPGIAEKIHENLPADFMRSHDFGYDKGYTIPDRNNAAEGNNTSENRNKALDDEIAAREDSDPVKGLLKSIQKTDEKFETSDKTLDNKSNLKLFSLAWKSLRGQHRGHLLSRNEFALSDLDFSEVQNAMGGSMNGIELDKFVKPTAPNNSTEAPTNITVKFKEKNNKKNVQEDGSVANIAENFDKNRKENKENSDPNYSIIVYNIPIKSVNYLAPNYTTRTGPISTGKVEFDFYQEKANKEGLAEGFMHINIADLKIDNLIFSLPKETYAVEKINVTNLDFTIHKRFLLPDTKNRFSVLMSLMMDHLPAVFSNLFAQILQIKQRAANANGKGTEKEVKELLDSLREEVSSFVNMHISWDKLTISNFVSVTDKVEVIKEISTGQVDIEAHSSNNDVSLQQKKLDYALKAKELHKLKSKSLFKQNLRAKKIVELEEDLKKLRKEIDEIEHKSRAMYSTIKISDLSLTDENYVTSLATGILKDKKMANDVSIGKVDKTDMLITSTSTVDSVTSMEINVQNIEVASLNVSQVHYESDDKTSVINASSAELSNVKASFEVVYKELPKTDKKETSVSPSFIIRNVYAGKALLHGPANVTLDNKSFAEVENHTIAMEGVFVGMEVKEGENGKESSFKQLTIQNLSDANVKLPGLLMNLNDVSGKSISVNRVNSEKVAKEGEKQQSKWIVSADNLNGKVSYEETTEKNNEKTTNKVETDLSNLLIKGSYDQGTGRAFLENIGSSTDTQNQLVLESLSWKTVDGKLSIHTLRKPATLKGIQLTEVEVYVNPDKPSDIQSITILTAKVDQITTQGLSVTKDDKHITLTDKESKISNLEIKNLEVAKNTKGELALTKAQVNASSVNLAPFAVSAKDAWNANITNFTSGALAINRLESGGTEYDVDNLDVKGKYSNASKDKKSSQSTNINLDSKNISGSYKSEMIGKGDDAREVITISNKVDIPSIALNNLNLISPELELKVPGTNGSGLNGIIADLLVTIKKPSKNQVLIAERKAKQLKIDNQNKVFRTEKEKEEAKELEKVNLSPEVNVHVNRLDINRAQFIEAYLHSNVKTKSQIREFNVPDYFKNIPDASKEREYYETITDIQLQPGEAIVMNNLHLDNFDINISENELKNFKGNLTIGNDKNKAVEIGQSDFLRKRLHHALGNTDAVSMYDYKNSIVSKGKLNVGKIEFKGDSGDEYTFRIVKPEMYVKDTIRNQRINEFAQVEQGNVWARIAAANPGLSNLPFISAEDVTIVQKKSETDPTKKQRTFIVKNPTLQKLKIQGFEHKFDLDLEELILDGKLAGEIKITESEDGFNFSVPSTDITIEKLHLSRLGGISELGEGFNKEEDNKKDPKSTRGMEFLDAASGTINISLFGKGHPLSIESITREIGGKEVTEMGWIDLWSVVRSIADQLAGETWGRSDAILEDLKCQIIEDKYYLATEQVIPVKLFYLANNTNNVIWYKGTQYIKLSELANSFKKVEKDPAETNWDRKLDLNYEDATMRDLSALINREKNPMNPTISINAAIDFTKLNKENMGIFKDFNNNQKMNLSINIGFDQNKLNDKRKMGPQIEISGISLPGFNINYGNYSIKGTSIELPKTNINQDNENQYSATHIISENVKIKGLELNTVKNNK